MHTSLPKLRQNSCHYFISPAHRW